MPDDPTITPPTPPAPAPAPAPTPPAPDPAALGDAGKRALDLERDARQAAEKRARDAEAEAARLRQTQESENDRLKREADEGRAASEAATAQLREARTLVALSGKGLAGPKALAASKLLDGVEFDAEQNPTNLDARIDAAKAKYGDEVFAGATPAPTPTPTPTTPTPSPTANALSHPAFAHLGPRATPVPSEDDEFDAAFKRMYPHAVPPDPAAA
jgi:hypothetical protein